MKYSMVITTLAVSNLATALYIDHKQSLLSLRSADNLQSHLHSRGSKSPGKSQARQRGSPKILPSHPPARSPSPPPRPKKVQEHQEHSMKLGLDVADSIGAIGGTHSPPPPTVSDAKKKQRRSFDMDRVSHLQPRSSVARNSVHQALNSVKVGKFDRPLPKTIMTGIGTGMLSVGAPLPAAALSASSEPVKSPKPARQQPKQAVEQRSSFDGDYDTLLQLRARASSLPHSSSPRSPPQSSSATASSSRDSNSPNRHRLLGAGNSRNNNIPTDRRLFADPARGGLIPGRAVRVPVLAAAPNADGATGLGTQLAAGIRIGQAASAA